MAFFPKKSSVAALVLGTGLALSFGQLGEVWAQDPRHSDVSQRSLQTFDSLVSSGKYRIVENSPEQKRLNKIGQTLASKGRRPIPWSFKIIDEEGPNALTLGEGLVVVTKGLFSLGLTDDELAGVLAHEIAHGCLQHLEHANQPGQQVQLEIQKILKEAAQLDADRKSGKIQAYVYENRAYFLKRQLEDLVPKAKYVDGQRKFARELSHEQEIEADRVGLRYVTEAGYSSDGLSKALEKLRVQGVKAFGSSFTGEGHTHPSLARRIMLLDRARGSL
jgi:beta-barrel assembly-enhancing protease